MAFSWGSSFLRMCRVANEQPRVKNENERTPCVLDTVLLICIFAVKGAGQKLAQPPIGDYEKSSYPPP